MLVIVIDFTVARGPKTKGRMIKKITTCRDFDYALATYDSAAVKRQKFFINQNYGIDCQIQIDCKESMQGESA